VTSGTLFQDTHKSLRLWFEAIWYVVNQKNGVSALGLQKALALGSYHTAWEWLQKLRRAMVRPNRDKLQGILEVDEAFIGGERSGKRGRGSEGKTLVFVAVERAEDGIGRIRLMPIIDASGIVLVSAIKQLITEDSIIYTDGWAGYNTLQEHGYTHISIAHKTQNSGDGTPLTHRVISLLKRWLLGTHQGAISHEYLPYYLDEFTFRFNRRKSRSRGLLFYRLIEQALNIDPLTSKIITTRSSI
jgi:transposase-like protein